MEMKVDPLTVGIYTRRWEMASATSICIASHYTFPGQTVSNSFYIFIREFPLIPVEQHQSSRLSLCTLTHPQHPMG